MKKDLQGAIFIFRIVYMMYYSYAVKPDFDVKMLNFTPNTVFITIT